MFGNAAGIRGSGAGVELYADDSQLSTDLARARRRIGSFARDINALGSKLFGAGVLAGGAVGLAAREFAQVDDSLRTTRGIAEATDAQFVELEATVRKLGATTSFTARQIAETTTELARGGQAVDQIIKSLPAVLALSRATGTGLSETGAIIVRTLGQFGLAADESQRVADVLAKASNSGSFALTDLGESLKFLGPVARELGIPIEETAAALAVLANNGLRGGEGARQFRRALLELSQTAKQERLAEAFNIDVTDSEGNLRNLTSLVEELGPKLKALGSADRIAKLEDIFGQGAVAFAGLAAGVDDLRAINAELLISEGTAAALADQIDGGLGGSFRLLVSAIQDLGITIGAALQDELIKLLQLVRKGTTDLAKWVQENEGAVKVLAVLIGSAVAIGGSIAALSAGLPVVTALASALASAAAVVSGPVGLAIGLGVVVPLLAALGYNVGSLLTSAFDELDASQGRVLGTTEKLLKKLSELSETGSFNSDSLAATAAIIEKLEGEFGDLGVSVDEVTGSVKGLADAIDRVALQRTIGNIEKSITQTEGRITEQEEKLAKFRRVQGLPNAQNHVIEGEQDRLTSQLRFFQRELADRRNELSALGEVGASNLRRDDGTLKGSGPTAFDRSLDDQTRELLRRQKNNQLEQFGGLANDFRDVLSREKEQRERELEQAATSLSRRLSSAGIGNREGTFGGRDLNQRLGSQTLDIADQTLAENKRQTEVMEAVRDAIKNNPGLLAL